MQRPGPLLVNLALQGFQGSAKFFSCAITKLVRNKEDKGLFWIGNLAIPKVLVWTTDARQS